ncbi:non-ribosomal peptide synthetase [Gordonia phthalatica]|uniref:non-ribosomal peptide synthetase n=1 Tax=Gordonia phthalatica TaxID=1136941 RepID=UPI0007815866|nr:non-ribosomal peptide synthetase [Gordonia phthalatica]
MSDLKSLAGAFARIWGADPGTVELIAFAAHARPDAVALTGSNGPVSFATLNAQVAAMAGVFVAQGLDPEAAVGAAVTPAVAAGSAPDQIADATAAAIASIRDAALEVAQTFDLNSLPGIFRSIARRFADRVALTDMEGAELTYAELDAVSDELAAGLIASGVGPEGLVGVGLARNAELIIALLGVTKAGAAYLPLDRSHPIDRLASIVDDARPVIALTDTQMVDEWSDLNVPLATVDEVSQRATDTTRASIPTRVHGSHPAYVMYTSGSTGKPKGVVVTHADVVTLLSAMGREYDYSPDDVWTMFQSYAFDVSVGEIWVALSFGGRLVVLDYLTTRTPDRFVEVLAEQSVTIVNLTPSAFYQLAGAVREPAPGVMPPSVRSMIFVGEALDFEQVRRWFADRQRYDGNDGPELNNMYGPTEATVYMTRRVLTPEFVAATLASDVGMALTGSRMYVLDSRLAKTPDGVPGDLYLAGDQLARGYAGRFELNATRFVADPFGEPGDRMYQSGDVAIFRHGSLEFLGRADGQVKLRGYRIELGEVEAGLLAADGVNAAAAAIKSRPGFPDQLVGYVVGAKADGSELDPAEIRRTAGTKVPDYMVPDIIMLLDQLPLNVSGKLDRRALPQPVITATAEFVAPETRTETVLAEIFSEVLGLDEISVVESVFDVGGNSLLAARIVGRACDELGVELNLRDLFEAPTVRTFAERAGSVGTGLAPITRFDPRPAVVPLSFAQARMWFINQFDPTEATYNLPALLRLTGDLDVAALHAAVADAVMRHEVLRTTFPSYDGTPVQVAAPRDAVADGLDWAVVSSETELAAAVATGFDVAEQWPIRARLWSAGEGTHVFALVVHHIAADGESMLPLVGDIVTAYTARAAGAAPQFAPLSVQFADYALWQREALGSARDAESVLGKQLGYWREQLAGLPEVLDLPADRPRPKTASHAGDRVNFTVPAEVGARIADVARDSGTTAFMVVHAAFAVLLARLSATDDIAIATPIAGRGQSALDHLVGMFVNTLVLRTTVDASDSFTDLLDRARTVDLDAFANADVPFESVVEALDPVRSEAFSPLAQVMLSFDPAASVDRLEVSVDGVAFEQLDPPTVPAQFDLSMIIRSGTDGSDWTGMAVFATDLFDPSTISTLADRFVALLTELVTAPSRAVGDAVLLTADESAHLLAGSAGESSSVPAGVLVDGLARRGEQSPDAVALVSGARTVSYSEFAARVAVLARELIALGVGPETAVAVCLDRSIEMVVAVHAVIAAGGRYVPVDTALPGERARYMLETADARVVLVGAGAVPDAVSSLPADAVTVVVDASAPVDVSTPPVSDSDRRGPVHPDTAAYTLFTSGSTGRPKGVTVSHGALANLIDWFDRVIGDVTDPTIMLKTPYTFDVSVPELFWPMIRGSRMVIAEPDGHRDPEYLRGLIARDRVSIVQFVPSMLSVFLEDHAEGEDALASLERVHIAGEALPPAVSDRILATVPQATAFNHYGPTEDTVYATTAVLRPGVHQVPIGRAVENTSTYVLDDRLRPVPAGVPGELYLGGVQLARGYAAQPGLTAERFVADPFVATPGARLYRTGDLVRWNAVGEIEYLGRTDFQVKLRGQRIELGEIESVLTAAPGVVKAAATVATAPGGAQHLVAYLSPSSVDVDEIRTSLERSLPSYMVPTVWTVLDDIALNSAGKLNRRALPEPEFGTATAEFTGPATATEEALAAVFAGLLGVERVSVTESFFALGGDSIMSIQLASAMRAAGHDLSPRQIFELKTVRDMAAALETGTASVPVLPELPGGAAGDTVVPPTVSWMLEYSDQAADFADYSQALVLAAPQDLTADGLAEVLGVVIDHHPMLSASLAEIDGAWRFTAGNTVDVAGLADAASSDGAVGSAAFDADLVAAHARAAGRLDPAAGRLVQATIVDAADGGRRIVLVIHHIGVDAVSWRAIIEDLATAWAQRSAGVEYVLRDNTTSARTWFAAIADRLPELAAAEAAYWSARVPEQPTDFGTALDPARDRQATAHSIEHRVDADVTEHVLVTAPAAFNGNVNDVLLGALARAVRSWQIGHRIADAAPVTVLVEGHGRYEEVLSTGDAPVRADLSRSVGWFTSIAPVSIDPSTDVAHAVKAAKEERLSQPNSGLGFGWLRYHGDTGLSERPMPSIVFNYLGTAAAGSGDAPSFTAVEAPILASSPAGGMRAQAALTINVSVRQENDARTLVVSMSAPEAVLSTDDITDIAHRWSDELHQLADVVDAGAPVGLSPSDVPGAELTQADLDVLADRFPGAEVWPLSPLQGGLFFQSALAAETSGALDVYVAQAVLELGTGVDGAKLKAAAETVLDAHRVLRSGFVPTPSGAVAAVVPAHVDLPWTEIVLDAASTDVSAQIQQIADEQRVLPFDLTAPPLLRFVLVRHGDTATLVVTNHHIILDGWSGPLVLADVLAVYATGSTYTSQAAGAATGDFGDFLRLVAGRDKSEALDAWRRVLAGIEGPTLVSTGVAATRDMAPRDHEITVAPDLLADLESVARAHNATLSTVLQLGWAVFLSRLTGNQVVTFGETVSGRPSDLPGVESMIGLFINTLPAVVDVDPTSTVAEVLERIQADKVAVLDHQHLSLPEIAAVTTAPLGFDTLTIHESYPVDADSLTESGTVDGGLAIHGAEIRDSTHYPLNMVTEPAGDGLTVRLKYLPAAFADQQIVVFAAALLDILRGIASAPESSVADISLDSAIEVVSVDDNGEVRELSTATVADVVAGQVATNYDATALWFEGRAVSYAEFGDRVNALGRKLIALGVGPESTVAVSMPRSVEMMVAIHAVVAAGGQYVPVNVDAPADRVEYMFETAGVEVVLTAVGSDPAGVLAAAGDLGLRCERVDASADVPSGSTPITDVERLAPLGLDNSVYTLFTSGSTGRPKGVTLTHRAVINRLRWGLDELPIDGTDVVVQKTPYTFDCSVPELFAPFMVGARLVVLKPEGHVDPLYVAQVIEETRATMVHFVPSMLSVFLEVVGPERVSAMSSIRIVSTTGEALPPAVAAELRAALPSTEVAGPDDGVLFYNLYGPTEAAVEITAERIDAVSSDSLIVPIGQPIWNSSAVVLDSRLRRVPAGVPGELYLGGVQLARGYAARADLTAERFVADPFGSAGERLYRTGDLVRWNTAGEIEYLGRTDFQVKLRGQRVELGEIESVLAGAPGVVHAAATVADGPGGSQHLVGYVSGAGEDVDLDAVQAAAREALPGYMVPTVWMVLDDIALNSAGKLDRRALPEPDFGAVSEEFVEAEGESEAALAAVFAEVLGVDRVSVTESFFDLGGNSLSAMRLAARAGSALGVEVSVRDLFEAPSVRGLIGATAANASTLAPVTAVVPRPERIPLSFAQQRMWFINRFEPGSPVYNLPTVLRLTGPLDPTALRAAVIDVTSRHEILRTNYPAFEGEPYQLVGDVAEFDDRAVWRTVGSEAELVESVMAGFDVASQWPLRVMLFAAAPDEHVLAVVAHHIAVDGESLLPLVTDLLAAYVARSAGSVPEFVALPVQFADFAIWQHEVLGSPEDASSVVGRQLGYWREQLAGLPDVLELPADRSRPVALSHRGRRVGFEIPAAVAGRIGEVARSAGATEFMVVHAALAVLLSRLSAGDDIAIGTPVAGRGQAVLDPLVGMFVNTLVLRTAVDPGSSFAGLLDRVRAVDLDAFAHADVPFETVVDAVDPVRSEAFAPLAQVILSFDPGASVSGLDASVAGLQIAAVEPEEVPAQLDLYVTVSTAEAGQAWSGSVVFETDLFDAGTVESMMARFVGVLDAVTADASLPVGDVPMLGAPEVAVVAASESGAAVTVPAVETVWESVAAQVVRTPDAAALEFGGRELSYEEFGARVSVLARELVAAGVGPDVAVALSIPRSVEMVVAIHAIVAAGGGYVPVDVEAPAERVGYMFDTASVGVVLVGESTADGAAARVAAERGARVIEVDCSGAVDRGVALFAAGERLSAVAGR